MTGNTPGWLDYSMMGLMKRLGQAINYLNKLNLLQLLSIEEDLLAEFGDHHPYQDVTLVSADRLVGQTGLAGGKFHPLVKIY
jgi:hypothetical protein